MDNMDISKLSKDFDHDSKNFFNIEQEFFIIDSENLSDVKTRFYGFSVQSEGIFEQENMTDEAMCRLDGCGCYVSVDCIDNGQIKIRQDFNGSYGIYFLRDNERFILSNSFFRLLDYVKYLRPLSLNRDYANHILLEGLASRSYSETPINEIKLIDRNLEIFIETKTKDIMFHPIDYEEGKILLDSEEGISLLDEWFHKWTGIFYNLSKCTDQISAQLSGGFDSRLTFALLLSSGIKMDDINVISYNDSHHSHKEDYFIASQIADCFGFKLNPNALNTRNLPEGEAINYSLEDIINISFYTKMMFHKEMYYQYGKFAKKQFLIPGGGW